MDAKERAKIIRGKARELHKDMPQGGFHSKPKGRKGYTRKTKHKGAQHD